MTAIALDGAMVLALAFIIALTITDIIQLAELAQTAEEYMMWLYMKQVLGSPGGGIAMAATVCIAFAGLVAINVTAASRVLWSLSRDRGVPGWQKLCEVGEHKRPKTTLTAKDSYVCH